MVDTYYFGLQYNTDMSQDWENTVRRVLMDLFTNNALLVIILSYTGINRECLLCEKRRTKTLKPGQKSEILDKQPFCFYCTHLFMIWNNKLERVLMMDLVMDKYSADDSKDSIDARLKYESCWGEDVYLLPRETKFFENYAFPSESDKPPMSGPHDGIGCKLVTAQIACGTKDCKNGMAVYTPFVQCLKCVVRLIMKSKKWDKQQYNMALRDAVSSFDDPVRVADFKKWDFYILYKHLQWFYSMTVESHTHDIYRQSVSLVSQFWKKHRVPVGTVLKNPFFITK